MSKKRQVPIAGDESILVRSYAVTHPRGLGLPTRSFDEWDQLVFATHGVMTVDTSEGTWVIPPQRALWLPADRRFARLVIDLLESLPTEPLHVPLPRDARALRAAQRILASGGAASTWVVAREVGASVRTLERLFARDTMLTLGRWCRRARMTEALRLIADGASVTETATAVGYQTPSAFVAAFRRELGTTPSRYFVLAAGRGEESHVPTRRSAYRVSRQKPRGSAGRRHVRTARARLTTD